MQYVFDLSMLKSFERHKSSISGAHTNTIESAWRHAKDFVRPKRPKTTKDLQTLLYVYMWRSWRGQMWPGGHFVRLLNDIKHRWVV